MSRLGVIEKEPDGICELCGKKAELRPYGPRGERICSDCGMKNIKITERQFIKHVLGEPIN